jgi:hypothetical protein
MGKKHLSRKAVEGLISSRMADPKIKVADFAKLGNLYLQITETARQVDRQKKLQEITVREAQEELAGIPKPTTETDLIRQIEKQKKEEKQ